MLFPMMALEIPPTPYAIRMRPWFCFLLALCALLAIGKFAISDFWGGISMILVCMMGSFVITGEHGLNVVNCLFYSVMAMISGIFDVIACVMYLSHSKYALFDSKAPTMVIIAQTVFVASPIVLFASSCLSYAMYSDCRQSLEESAPLDYDDGYGYGARDYRPPPPPPPRDPPRGPPRDGPGRYQTGPRGQQTRPFSGQGQRLGSGNDERDSRGQRLGTRDEGRE